MIVNLLVPSGMKLGLPFLSKVTVAGIPVDFLPSRECRFLGNRSQQNSNMRISNQNNNLPRSLVRRPGLASFLPAGHLAAVLIVLSAALGASADEICQPCAQTVDVGGQFGHFKSDPSLAIQGAKDDGSAFHEEIFGENFTITVPHLPAGKYTVVIGEVENYFNTPNQRVFDIAIGNKTVAAGFDIIAVAGGPKRAVYLTNTVEHVDDSVLGPLTVTFTGRVEKAKLNTFELWDSSGVLWVAIKASDLSDPLAAFANKLPAVTGPEIWKDSTQPVAVRVNDLISRLSLGEKVQQIRNDTPAIRRLGIPSYDFWNEALHGVARNGFATVFPQAIGLAATWDVPLVHAEADVISTEGRAKFNEYTRTHGGNSRNSSGLTFWSPNINIFRDPRWGRGQETYGEDPFLTGELGVAFIRGLQGNDPNYVKAMACAKHFAVHSGPEPKRHRFDAEPPERDFFETYLPQFEQAVREAHVDGVMGAYNSLYGTPACADPRLLTDILRKQWGFTGYIVSDCGAINDIHANHHFAATPEAAAAAAVKAGCDICCGGDYNALLKAVKDGLISEQEIDGALAYALTARFRLGLFDPPAQVPFSRIPISENDTPEHQAQALAVARESMVLLKNDGVLPLNRKAIKRLAVIGANAKSESVLLGNYNGKPSNPVTIFDGLKQIAGTNIEVTYDFGCPLVVHRDGKNQPVPNALAEAVAVAKLADAVIYVGGLDQSFEGEGHDRERIEMPEVQEKLLKALQATGKPVIFVNCSGSAVAMPWEADHLPAILQAWYPGEQGGRAVAEVLFGDVDPGGRLPVTFYRSTEDLPAFEDYSMSNRTYRYFGGRPLFAFGRGLSYAKVAYRHARMKYSNLTASDTIKLMFELKNHGTVEGDEVAQVYFQHHHSAVALPKLALCGFARVHLAAGETKFVTVDIPAQRFRHWDTGKKQYVVTPGDYELLIGAASDDIRVSLPLKITGQKA